MKISGFGAKTFEQAAGFLRVPESDNLLDNSWVHPESYKIAYEILELQQKGQKIDETLKKQIAEKYEKGPETVNDIIEDLKKPGRDPRDDIEKPILKDDILSIDDLYEGLTLKGTVRNVTKFGAFIDIGLKNDALVHVSEIADDFVEDPLSKVNVGQIVDVKIIGIDKERGRVSLTMKSGERKGKRASQPERREKTSPKKDGPLTLGDFFNTIKK